MGGSWWNAHGRTTFASLPTANWKYGIYTEVAPSPRAYVLYSDDVQVSTEPLVPGSGTLPPWGEVLPTSGPLPRLSGLRVISAAS
jgi:hypothetical protein